MSKIIDILHSFFSYKHYIEIDINDLPSMGIFYPDDFIMKISKTSKSDIEYYIDNYVYDDFISILKGIKRIISNNIRLSDGYIFSNILSIDILYLFIEIVKLTTGRDIYIIDNGINIKFCSDNFNYFEIDDNFKNKFDNDSKDFVYKGFRYSLPTTGVESSITRFLYEMSEQNKLEEFSHVSYDFLYFLGGRTTLKNDEIKNLITIFNDDISEMDKKITSEIVANFRKFSEYTLRGSNSIITLDSIDLKNIWLK